MEDSIVVSLQNAADLDATLVDLALATPTSKTKAKTHHTSPHQTQLARVARRRGHPALPRATSGDRPLRAPAPAHDATRRRRRREERLERFKQAPPGLQTNGQNLPNVMRLPLDLWDWVPGTPEE